MTDSASDISYADEKKYNISVIPFPITLGDKTYTSRVDFDNEQFYEWMAQYDEIPKTSQITPFQFQEIYLREARSGVTDLVLVLINSKGSSTYDNSVQAIDLFFDEYPEYRDVHKAQELLDFISDESNVPALRTFTRDIDGVRITIGPENGSGPLQNASMVYATYNIGNMGRGLIGIVGPTRMDYAKLSARLALFSKGLNRLIAETFFDEDDK